MQKEANTPENGGSFMFVTSSRWKRTPRHQRPKNIMIADLSNVSAKIVDMEKNTIFHTFRIEQYPA